MLKDSLQNVNTDFSASMVRMNEEYLVQDLVAAGGGFKANVEFVDKMVREMRQSLQRMKRLGSKTRTDREDAIAAMEDDDAAKAFSVQQVHGSSTGRLDKQTGHPANRQRVGLLSVRSCALCRKGWLKKRYTNEE